MTPLKAVELRPCNLIQNGYVVTIQYHNGIWGCLVTSSLFSSGHDWVFVKESDLKPVPLTPELLERFGFQAYNDDGGFELIEDKAIQLHENYLEGDGFSFVFDTQFLTVIRYAHQLQNLYFALTGNELTLKQ